MAEQIVAGISIAIDTKKNRIRIHKPTLHLLGDPKLIQLLFDPADMVVAIRCPNHEEPGGQEIRVHSHNISGDNCVEFYSLSLIKKMSAVNSNMQNGGTYRLVGEILLSKRIARFPMSSLQRIENG